MSIATLRDKVEQLIEKAQNAGGGSGGSVIEFPEFGYTRPSWWLPYPTLTVGEDVNEIWFLMEVSEDLTEYDGIDITNAKVVREGYKQFWKRVEGTEQSIDGVVGVRCEVDAVEILANCKDKLMLVASNAITYRSTSREDYQKLELITGTPLYVNSTSSNFALIRGLRAVTNDVYIATGNSVFAETNLRKSPNIIYGENGKIGSYAFHKTPIIDGGEILFSDTAYCFAYASALEKVRLLNGCATATTMFASCKQLRDVSVEKDFSNSLYLSTSTKYTQETLHAIIENLADMTGQTAPTFKIGETNITKIDEEHITILNNKNWTYE